MFTDASRQRRGPILGCAIAAAIVALSATASWAVYLDKDQNISFRGRVYSQWSVRADKSPETANYTTIDNPTFAAGQLVQQRNFYNPELDADLTSYTKFLNEVSWLDWLTPDDLGFRVAAWGFYDGVYDYGSGQYATANSAPRVVAPGTEKPFITSFAPGYFPLPQQIIQYQNRPCTFARGCQVGTLFNRASTFATNEQAQAALAAGQTLDQIYEPTNGREVFGTQNRVNELYLSYSKGPLFVRLGRQSISWGESDTIALLDANNPFDITLGVPGFFQDLEEARIPLWTLRTSYELFRSAGPFSSAFIEGYLVPGSIDNHVAIAPSPTGVSAYGPTGIDPHLQLAGNLFGQLGEFIGNSVADQTAIVLVDKLPLKQMKRSRGGARFQTIIGGEHTASGWWYRTYNNAPVARLVSIPNFANRQPLAISTTERADVDVFGIADTFYNEWVDSIIRLEAEYFLNEMSFLEWRPAPGTRNPQDPTQVLPPELTAPEAVRQMANIPQDGTTNYGKPVPRTNHLRWEIGMDHNAFISWLNPTNSLLVSGAFVGDYNIDATVNKRYGYGPGRPTKAFESIFQLTLQTDYLHGKLTPRLTSLFNYGGSYGFNARLDYRITDYLIAGLQGAFIGGKFHQLGFFRDYDQIGVRMTYQLN